MDFGPQQVGKWLVVAGLVIAGVGLVVILLGKIGFFKLPGDTEYRERNVYIFFPIVSCILLSIIVTLILWIISYFRR